MQSSYIKEEPNLSDGLVNKQNRNNDIVTASSDVAFKIKSEPLDDGFTTSESFIDNLYRCISIIKEEVDVSDDNELDEKIIYDENLEKIQKYNYCEIESTNVKWPSKYKSITNGTTEEQRSLSSLAIISINNKSLKSNNKIVLKSVTVPLERMSMSKISRSRYKKSDSQENISENEGNKKLASFYKLYCSQCNKTIDATSLYKATKCRTCKTTMSMQCKKCESSFNRLHTMRYHINNRCYPRKKYHCAHCNFETTVRYCIQRHIQRRHNENNQSIKMESAFSCAICPFKSYNKHTFKNHMASHEMFNKLMQESRSNANDKSMTNDIKSESTTALMEIKVLNNFERFCPHCNITFENNTFSNSKRSSYFMHKCHLCKTRLLLQCLKCNIRLIALNKMREHLVTKCALKINYKCLECNHETVHKSGLKDHIKRWHTIIDPKELNTCPKCDKTFKITSDFKRHLKNCGLYKYHCDHCFFRTKEKRSMRNHVQKHMNTGPVKVKKNLKDKYWMKAYCSTCNALRKAGPRSKMLCRQCKNRMMFKCRICNEKASTRKDILLHESKKHGRVYHDCPNCDKTFLLPSNLKEHIKICKDPAVQKK